MQKRTLVVVSAICVVLMSVISCSFLAFNRTARYGLFTALGKTGSATVVYEQATLIVVSFPIDPARKSAGTTYQALGVQEKHPQGYELKSLATEASVVLNQNRPLAVSQDRAYLQVGDQQVQLSNWTLVEPRDRAWEPLRGDVDTSTSSPSKNDQVFFSIRSNREGYSLLRGIGL